MNRTILIYFIIIMQLLNHSLVFGEGIKKDCVDVYLLNKADFLELLDNSSIETLQDNKTIDKYSVVDYQEQKYLRYRSSNGENISVFETNILNISTNLSKYFFELCTDTTIAENLLLEKNIRCKINRVIPFYTEFKLLRDFNIPLTLFVSTDVGNYFITVNEKKSMENAIELSNDEYTLVLYTQEQYQNRFKLYDGDLLLDGSCFKNSQLKFQTTNCYIPLRFVMEKLGCSVDWDEETKCISVTYNDRTIKLSLDENSITIHDYENGLLQSEIVDDCTIVYCYELGEILKALDLNLDITLDSKNHILEIIE